MHDEASLRRLAEMGIDVYVPRSMATRAPETPGRAESMNARAEPVDVLLIAGDMAPRVPALITDIERALRCMGVRCLCTETPDAAALAAAAAVIVCGQAHAREIGARIPAQRQREIGWVVTDEWPTLIGHGSAKRALWSELRRVVRSIVRSRADLR
ncbi:MAG: hypothetical protein LBQ20_09180 [Rhodanobacter sp.]|jgi:hypothetical protein|nr:hypothetical protein [Rhodanobacter sp.]